MVVLPVFDLQELPPSLLLCRRREVPPRQTFSCLVRSTVSVRSVERDPESKGGLSLRRAPRSSVLPVSGLKCVGGRGPCRRMETRSTGPVDRPDCGPSGHSD